MQGAIADPYATYPMKIVGHRVINSIITYMLRNTSFL
jgi:hypothetical protein